MWLWWDAHVTVAKSEERELFYGKSTHLRINMLSLQKYTCMHAVTDSLIPGRRGSNFKGVISNKTRGLWYHGNIQHNEERGTSDFEPITDTPHSASLNFCGYSREN